MNDFSSAVPILRSFDERATKAFYLDFLEFEIVFEHRFEPGAPLYMGVRKGACDLHLSEHHGDSTPGSAVRIDVPDVRSLCEALNAKNYRHARPGVLRQTWGYDEMPISDPSGNRLVFGTPFEVDA
ncbi:MAG: glyoxalase superfamily protein [Pseudomonadota bacterium]